MTQLDAALTDELARLTQRQRAVLCLRFGLQGAPPKTLASIGVELGVSRERVRQLEELALSRLRVNYPEDPLHAYFTGDLPITTRRWDDGGVRSLFATLRGERSERHTQEADIVDMQTEQAESGGTFGLLPRADGEVGLSEPSRRILQEIAAGRSYEEILASVPGATFMRIFEAAAEALRLLDRPEHCCVQPKPLKRPSRLEEIRMTHPRAYFGWLSEEEERLSALFEEGMPISDMSRQLQRQPGGIRSRLVKLGLIEDGSAAGGWAESETTTTPSP